MRTLRRLCLWVLCLGLLGAQQTLPAQGLTGLLAGEKSTAAKEAAPTDRLKRQTPRSSMLRFLEACHAGKYNIGAQYLDLSHIPASRRATEGPELAKVLEGLLDRNARFEVSKLSDSPEGNTEDGQVSGLDTLATFDLNGEPVVLHLQRVNEQGMNVWLVSSASVGEIRGLAEVLGERAIEKHLPAPLVTTEILGTSLWIWLALVLAALVISFFSRLLTKLLFALIRPVGRRYIKSFHEQRLLALTEPLRLVLSVIVFRACIEIIGPGALFRDALLKLLALLFWMGCASLLMRIVDVISDTVSSRLDPRQYALSYSVVPLIVRFIKICIFCLAALVILSRWGYNTDTILAGLGVGGIAVALAAQKTIENLFGGVSLIFDRPVLVGDFCQFGGQVGTVEDIGLRSTRIRTLDRTVVTIPNSQFSTMTLENYTKRDRMWFHPTIRLRRDTRPEEVQAMMAAIKEIFEKHEQVDPTDVPVRFTKITETSLDLDLFAYVLTPDFNQYLRVQTELLLKILEAASKLGVGMAVPFQEEYNVSVDWANHTARFPYQAVQSTSRQPLNGGSDGTESARGTIRTNS
jgi:MscS family membrane protein